MNADQRKSMLLAKHPYRAARQLEISLSTCIDHVRSDGGTLTPDT